MYVSLNYLFYLLLFHKTEFRITRFQAVSNFCHYTAFMDLSFDFVTETLLCLFSQYNFFILLNYSPRKNTSIYVLYLLFLF